MKGTLRVQLKTDAHPSMTLVVLLVIECGNGVGEGKEMSGCASCFGQPFLQETIFVGHHLHQPFSRHVAAGVSIDRIAELHVIGRHGLGYGTGRPTCLKEITSDLLSGPDFRKGTVLAGIEIDPQGFFFDR